MIDRDTGWHFMPTSVKGIVLDADHKVLLARNPRAEWELPGGWPDATDASPEATVSREVLEETGLNISVKDLVDCAMISVGAGDRVLLVFYRCIAPSFDDLRRSPEHDLLQAFSGDEIRDLAPQQLDPVYQRAIGLALEKPASQKGSM